MGRDFEKQERLTVSMEVMTDPGNLNGIKSVQHRYNMDKVILT